MTNLDKEFCFPTRNTPSISSAQSVTSQYGNMINSTSRSLLNGTDSNQGQCPILTVSHPQMEGFSFNNNFMASNISTNYQIQNASLSGYSLLFDRKTPLGLNNSLLKDPCFNLSNDNSPDNRSLTLLSSSFPVENENVLIGGNNNNAVHDNGTIMKPKESTNKKSTCNSGNGGSSIQEPAAHRRKGYKKKFKKTFSDRSSMYRGVSRYSGRYEAFLWDNTNPLVKGRTVYVGGFEREEDAARAYDLAALKFWGRSAPLNFPINDYEKELAVMPYVSREEFLLKIRRKSKGFAKGVSNYRGVSRNSDGKKWQARLGKGKGSKGIYLGTFQTEVEAARAYDVAVLRMKGMNAITNFDLNHYDFRYILESSRLPIGKGASKMVMRNSVEEVLEWSKKSDIKLPVVEPHDHDHVHHDDQTSTPDDHHDNFQNNALITPISSAEYQNPNSYLGDNCSTGSASAAGLESDPTGDSKSIVYGTRNLELEEDFQFFNGDQFYLRQIPSFYQSLPKDGDDQLHTNPSFYQSLPEDGDDQLHTNPSFYQSLPEDGDDQSHTNPSFLNLLTAASGSSCDSNGLELGDLTLTQATGDRDGAALVDISWTELQQMEAQEFHDFHDFFSHENNNEDADFEKP